LEDKGDWAQWLDAVATPSTTANTVSVAFIDHVELAVCISEWRGINGATIIVRTG
jgi:ssRNA-specific RNase YbeY (16S rRNA maturation enzyme)